jgi:hypothetical protein
MQVRLLYLCDRTWQCYGGPYPPSAIQSSRGPVSPAPGFGMRGAMAPHAASTGASPLSGRTGSEASQSSISLDNHMLLPPTTRARGNIPLCCQVQIVGKVTLAMAQTSLLSRSRKPGREIIAAALVSAAFSAKATCAAGRLVGFTVASRVVNYVRPF